MAAPLQPLPPALMEQRTFERFRALIYSVSGIALSEFKCAMVSARLQKRVRELGLRGGYQAYYDLVVNDRQGAELVTLINLVSTNVTPFFSGIAAF